MIINYKELISVIEKLSSHDWFDYLNLSLSILALLISIGATIINIWLVNRNTNKQISNQNKENNKPRLKLKEINIVENNLDKRYLYAYSKFYQKDKQNINLYVKIILNNIGYGIANDISFYTLNNGEKCVGIQCNNQSKKQCLNSTIEIPKNDNESIDFIFEFNDKGHNPNEYNDNDFILLLCNYKDLNNNNYKLLIGFILKQYLPFDVEEDDGESAKYNNAIFDCYYYQENTDSFNGMINKEMYINNYKKILEEINKTTDEKNKSNKM